MKPGLTTQFISCLFAIFFIATLAHAGELPSLKDPFLTQKKIAPYGKDLKPVSCPLPPDTSKPLTLGEVVVTTLCHNPDSRAAYLTLLANADNYDSTVMSYLPDITSSATGTEGYIRTNLGHSKTKSSGVSASTSVTLYDFGRREANLQIAERTLIAAGLSYDSTLQGFIATSLQNYFKLLTSQNALTIEEQTYALAKATYDAANTRYKLGLAPLSDMLQAQTSLSQSELTLTQAQNTLVLDRAALAQLLGFTPLTEVKVAELSDDNITAMPFNDKLIDLIERAKQQRLDLKASELSLANAEDSLANQRRRGRPSISASASRTYGDWDIVNRNNPNDTIGVSVTIPIFTGFKEIFNERAATKNLEAQKLQLIQSERNVEQDVLRSWQNFSTSHQSFAISRSALSAAEELKNVALGRYKEGLGSILDLQNAEIAWRNALQNELTSRYNLLTTRVDLVRSVGELDLNSIEPPREDMPELAAVVNLKSPVATTEQSHEEVH